MAMEVHETTPPMRDTQAMTAASGDVGVTESHAPRRQTSFPCDPEWADFLKSLGQDNQTTTTTNPNMDLAYFGYDENAPANFGAMEDAAPPDLLSATSTNSSSSSSVCDSGSAPQPFQPSWPIVPEQQPMFNCGPITYQPAQWLPEHRFEQPMHPFGYHGPDGLGIHVPPTSNPVDMANQMSYHDGFMEHQSPIETNDSFGNTSFNQGWPRHGDLTASDEMFCDEGEDGGESADPCYAQLLYKCLKEAPSYTLSLRELYEWVSRHSQKAKDPKNRGWQNSVRHNLSMNAAFIRVQPGPGSTQKKGSLWRLTDEALREGVISTTRYRKDPKRRPERRAVPALNRQVSGAKGGRATRDASRLRQQQQQQQQQQQRLNGHSLHHRSRRSDRHRHGPAYSPYGVRSAPHSPVGQPHFIPAPMSTPQPPSHPPSPYFNIVEDSQIAFGDELTPTGFALPGQQPPPLPEDPLYPFGDSNTKPSSLTNFEMLPLDLTQAPLFGDHDPELGFDPNTPTPSLMTEESFMADDNIPQLMSCGTSREASTFQ